MDYRALIGSKVTHGVFGDGIINDIIEINDNVYASVDFNGTIKSFLLESLEQHFSFDDETRVVIQKMAEKILADRAEEAARIAEEAAVVEIEPAAQRQRQRNHNRVERDERSIERTSNDTMYFIVFQGDNFGIESNGNYLWAPLSDTRWTPFWERMTQLRENDIIFHCCGGEIQAVSVVQGSCYDQIAPSGPGYDVYAGRMGRKVDSVYTMARNTIVMSNYRLQIMATYPAGSHYDPPFDRNGDGRQGYLFELDKDLAKIFLNDIMNANPGWHI